MSWRRSRGGAPPADPHVVPGALPEIPTWPAPGTAALLDGVSQDRSHAVLDLGPASDQSLRVYSRYARWIRFDDLLGEAWWPKAEAASARLVLPPLERSYDLVFAWDILDRLSVNDRFDLVRWLADATPPGGRVHVVVRGSDDAIACPLRFTLVDVGHIRYEPAGTAHLPVSRLLPAEVAKVLAPMRVAHAFTLKNGLREYVALRPREV